MQGGGRAGDFREQVVSNRGRGVLLRRVAPGRSRLSPRSPCTPRARARGARTHALHAVLYSLDTAHASIGAEPMAAEGPHLTLLTESTAGGQEHRPPRNQETEEGIKRLAHCTGNSAGLSGSDGGAWEGAARRWDGHLLRQEGATGPA
eukprot:6186703-Pleurochrysis_carterae.AAC.2